MAIDGWQAAGDGTYSIQFTAGDTSGAYIKHDPQWYWYNATTTSYTFDTQYLNKPKKREGWMTLYKVYMVDIRKSAVTSEHTRIGKDEADAGIGLTLTEDEQKLRAKDELAILWQCIGEFEKLKRSRVVVDKEE